MPNVASTLVALAACVAVFTGCRTAPAVRTVEVNRFQLPYVAEGEGAAVVFIHGAVSDYRTWNAQRAALAARGYRAISYTQRYFGPAPWAADWPAFGIQTHVDDLVAFLRALGVGPVHLVAWSYGGQTALALTLDHPELVMSAFIYEPAHPTYVTDPAQIKALREDGATYVGPIVQALRSGDNPLAVKRLIDGVGERDGYFDAQPPSAQAVQLDSARSMPVMFDEKNVPQITCEQLARIQRPVAIVRGGQVRPYFRIIADQAALCMKGGGPVVIPGKKHMWPAEDVAGFTAAVSEFIAQK